MVERRRSTASEKAKGGGNYFAQQQAGVKFFSSGCKPFDMILGGGWAEEHVINIVGDNSTGKTLLAIEAAANFIKKYPKGKVRYREAENAFDQSYAEAIGMPLDAVDFGEPDTPFETVEDLYEELDYRCGNSKHPELIVVDSLDALTSRAEQARDIDEGSYGGEKAKKMSELFRRKIGPMKRAQVTLMIISQTRDKIGVTFGKKWTRTGGKALNFYASQIVYLAHKQHVYGTANKIRRPVGDTIIAKMDKCKVGLPFRQTEFSILFGFGVDDLAACLDFAKENDCEDDVLDKFGTKAKFMNFMDKASNAEYRDELKRIHKIVEQTYWKVEESFLPKRRKYDD